MPLEIHKSQPRSGICRPLLDWMDATTSVDRAANESAAAARGDASVTGDASASASSAVDAAALTAASPSQLVEHVVQIKRRRLHINLTGAEVGVELRRHSTFSKVTDRQLRTAVEKANKVLGIGSRAAADVKSWRCSMDAWTEAQLATL